METNSLAPMSQSVDDDEDAAVHGFGFGNDGSPPILAHASSMVSSEVAAATSQNNNDHDDELQSPMMAMLYRMEQKIESLQTRMESGGGQNDSDTASTPTMAAVAASNANYATGNDAISGSTAMADSLPVATTTTALVLPITTGKRKRNNYTNNNQNDNNGTTTSTLINKPNTNNDNNTPIKATRINWAKSPHRERLAIILNDWFSQTGLAIDDEQNPSGKPITDYKQYAAKVGISRTTLFKYIHKDPSKRRLVKEEGDSAGRGKKRLIDEGGVRFIVSELKAKADV